MAIKIPNSFNRGFAPGARAWGAGLAKKMAAAAAVPPPGTYDPMLDASLGQAQRGYFDLGQDTETNTERAQSGYANDVATAQQNEQRSLADILRARAQEGENYKTNTGLVTRKYGQLGESQTGQAVASGNARGGGLAAALAARTANQGIEQGALDTAHQRAVDASNLAETRTHQDYETPDTGILAKLQTAFQYGQDDATTQLGRAGRELTFYGQDIGAAKAAQAAQAGWSPTPAFQSKSGKDSKGNAGTWHIYPDGRKVFVRS